MVTARIPVLVVVWTRRPEWFDRARCRGLDPDLFHPSRGEDTVARHARAVCAVCPVCAECLEYALDNGEHWGIWGGTSERQRRDLRSRR